MIKSLIKQMAAKVVKDLTVDYNNFKVCGPFQDYGFLKALEAGKREVFTCQLFQECLQQDSHFLDIGAHLGQYTLLASQTISSSGTIHAYEPHPRSFSYLKKNVETNISNSKHIRHFLSKSHNYRPRPLNWGIMRPESHPFL